MAGIVLSGWPNGATVSAYVAPTTVSGTPDTDALGSAVTSGTASSAGQVTLSGLTAGTPYIASDGTTRRRFVIPTSAVVNDRDNGQPGIIAPSTIGWSPAAVGLVANQAFLVRFVPSRKMVASLVAFGVSTAAGADDAIDAGIYDAALNRLVSAGATTGKVNATGVKTVNLTPTALTPGSVYYAALSCGTLGGTAASLRAANFADSTVAQLYGAAVPFMEACFKGTSHPLPTSIVTPAVTTLVPVIAVRES